MAVLVLYMLCCSVGLIDRIRDYNYCAVAARFHASLFASEWLGSGFWTRLSDSCLALGLSICCLRCRLHPDPKCRVRLRLMTKPLVWLSCMRLFIAVDSWHWYFSNASGGRSIGWVWFAELVPVAMLIIAVYRTAAIRSPAILGPSDYAERAFVRLIGLFVSLSLLQHVAYTALRPTYGASFWPTIGSPYAIRTGIVVLSHGVMSGIAAWQLTSYWRHGPPRADKCVVCHYQNSRGARVCAECGANLVERHVSGPQGQAAANSPDS
jgi:hypothetical protein